MENERVKVYRYEYANKPRGGIVEWLFNVVGYAMILLTISAYFDSLYIESFSTAIVASLVISLLNITVKPILFLLTLPITIVTMGLFYPIVNVMILKVADSILGDSFNITGGFMVFIIAILISIMNILLKTLVIDPFINKR